MKPTVWSSPDGPARHRNEKLELVFNTGMAYLVRMNCSEKPLVFCLGGLLLATGARGDVNPPGDNSYHVVVERNAFGLSPPKVLPGDNSYHVAFLPHHFR